MFTREREKKVYSEKEKADFGGYFEEVEELLSYIEKVPMIKHAILSYFLEYKIKNQDLIQQFLDESGFPDHYNIKMNANGSE